jgi:glycosyltransferase involved in cell wall biosynthesis
MNKPLKLKKLKGKYPFVSICTPTFNRRPFIPAMISCFKHQDYPKDRMEWIIIDDGTDKIGDLVADIPQVKYFSYDKQMVLGKKRNISNKKAKGDVIIYMDDDDYQSPLRVSHSVQMLKHHPRALCAGSSILYIYFKHISRMYQFGPYGPNHSTAGTFAFRRELLQITSFDDEAALAEERHFLKDYTIPFVQLDSNKTILCISHDHNTFDKKTLLDNPNPTYTKPVDLAPSYFISDENLLSFYMDYIDPLLENYEAGAPSMKPEVIRQQKILTDNRKKINEPKITLTDSSGNNVEFTSDQIANMLNVQSKRLIEMNNVVKQKDNQIAALKNMLSSVQDVTSCDASGGSAAATASACDTPACDAPACDAPACDTPACDAPACDAPACDAPACDAPACDAPACDTPDCESAPE